MSAVSRRQRLLEFAETGRLRDAVERRVDTDVADLIVDICLRYASPRRSVLRQRARAAIRAAKGQTA